MRARCSVPAALLALLVARGTLAASTIDIRGDLNDTVFSKGKEHSIWTGSVVLTSEDSTIYADRIDLWGKDFVFAECEGNLRVVNRKKEMDLTADRISYNRETKFLVAQGNVYMEDGKNGIVVKGDSLQYDDERDEAIVQIRVRIFGDEEELQCRAEFARYLRGEELLVLAGTPYVRWKGDEYRALQITITLDDGNVKTVKMVEGTGRITTKEEEPARPAAPEPAPRAGGSPGPDGTAPAVGPTASEEASTPAQSPDGLEP
jgi:lipopolysaccharide export system protein LptA